MVILFYFTGLKLLTNLCPAHILKKQSQRKQLKAQQNSTNDTPLPSISTRNDTSEESGKMDSHFSLSCQSTESDVSNSRSNTELRSSKRNVQDAIGRSSSQPGFDQSSLQRLVSKYSTAQRSGEKKRSYSYGTLDFNRGIP